LGYDAKFEGKCEPVTQISATLIQAKTKSVIAIEKDEKLGKVCWGFWFVNFVVY